MALQPLNAYGTLSRAFDIFLLGLWILFLLFSQGFLLKSFFYFNGIAWILCCIALRWPLLEGLAILVLVSWIWGAFSLMPTALIFWAFAFVFIGLKLIVDSLELRDRFSVGLLFFGSSLLFYVVQWFMIHRLTDESFWAGHVFVTMAEASLVEGLVGLALGSRFLYWISPR